MSSFNSEPASVLDVRGLYKKYPAFELKDVSFSLEREKITGFIGRNGAGKSTTLNSLFNFVHPDSGDIEFFGENFSDSEFDIKKRVGFVAGGIDYYKNKKIKAITAVTKRFYESWDDAAYKSYINEFAIDEEKTPGQLSAGMKVKYALALALSHNAELLIMDEPTSGLDPVSRDELLDDFMGLCDKGITILFSTHITSDLDKCADDIIYIQNGKIIAETGMDMFVDGFRLLEMDEKPSEDGWVADHARGIKRMRKGYTVLLGMEDAESPEAAANGKIGKADLEDIMIHLEKGGRNNG